METKHLVATTDLCKSYDDRRAVDRLELRVRRGEIYGFLGPNGAGKTTTLRMLLGLVAPTGGSAHVLGRPPGDPRALARLGALIEGPGFYPYLSGRDNLRVLARYAEVPASRIPRVLEAVDLADRGGDRYSSYSLGMKQRLGVANALLHDPDLLILDEPTNGLDPAGMADMRVLLQRLRDDGRTVLLSSHQLGEVQQVCDRVGVINGGRLIAENTVEELRRAAALVIRAEPMTAAVEVVDDLLGAGRAHPVDGQLRLDVAAGEAAGINAALVGAGVRVHELRPVERTLEEVFLAMTDTTDPTATTDSSVMTDSMFAERSAHSAVDAG